MCTRFLLAVCGCLFFLGVGNAQVTYPVYGVQHEMAPFILVKNANIYTGASQMISHGEMLIHKGKILAVGTRIELSQGVSPMVVDMRGRFIYPAFVDIYTSFGLGAPPKIPKKSRKTQTPQYERLSQGALDWNDAIHPQENAYEEIVYDDKAAETLRKMGVAMVLTHRKDGIARGTGAVVILNNNIENLSIYTPIATQHFSFSKGSSQQEYPSSLMGSIALLRQTYLDTQWYATQPQHSDEGFNESLKALEAHRALPSIFETSDKWDGLRASRIAHEFGKHYIIKASGNEYQIIDKIKATASPYILPLHFPAPLKVEDPLMLRYLSFRDLKHWEMAPANPYFFQEEAIPFCLTFDGINDPSAALKALKKAVRYGLKEDVAVDALTMEPASLLGIATEVGSLAPQKMANFIVCNAPLFSEESEIMETWVQGEAYTYKYNYVDNGYFKLSLEGEQRLFSKSIRVEQGAFFIDNDKDTLKIQPVTKEHTITFDATLDGDTYSFSGVPRDKYTLYGTAVDKQLHTYTWSMVWTNRLPTSKKERTPKPTLFSKKEIRYPFSPYGNEELPKPKNLLIKGATVWTNTEQGVLRQTDVLVVDGKIAAVGKNLNATGAEIIYGENQHLTPGIIDEHSHIAITRGVNEATHAVTSEVRIGDVLNPEDINIYRQLSGGVTSSHLLHGSANPIGGQTQLIKLRWGKSDEELKFTPWTPFIKFALGENVKQTNWGPNFTTRFPQTRMGVEQVYDDAFRRAKEYGERMASFPKTTRKDLTLEALLEILNKKRFITCHSYLQSEINMMMKVAEKYGFTVRTFTHVLEGYKIADKLKKHGANVSTFSDWGTYKYEVNDAMPYNASIMHKMGLNVAINSDDAEMGRRLNQEAAKLVRYGGLDEQSALKTVTLNPAKMLNIDDRVGSIAVGKEADLVLWTDHPLSIYAEADKTIVDGTIYYDRSKNKAMQDEVSKEKQRILELMKRAIKDGDKGQPLVEKNAEIYDCHGLVQKP